MKPVRNDSVIILIFLIAIAAFLIGKKVGGSEDYTEIVPEDTAAFHSNRDRGERYDASRAHIYYNVEEKRAERFAFDPNTADSTQLLRLGLRPFMVRNIYKYRAKGGKFHKPEDFARIYGLTAGEYKSLEPYIKISSDYQPASTLVSEPNKSSEPKDSLRYPVKLSVGEHIVLSTADTTTLKRVPGIGSGYAQAIVNYRNRLGGYVDVNQLLDIKGIPQEALQYIVLGKSDVKKLDVNHLSLNQLKQHPYLNFYQARALVESRRLHGPLRSAADLRPISEFTEADIKRLIPYLQF